MECYWRVVQKFVDRKEILKVNILGLGNEKFKDILNVKRYFVFFVFKILKKFLKYFVYLSYKYVSLKVNDIWIKNRSFFCQIFYRNLEI